MAEVLCVYRKVKLLKKAVAGSKKKASDAVAIISYDEKPGIQAIATTSPDLPPEPGVHATFARDHEYKRHGTLSLLAGIDLLSGKVHALVRDRHRSREFIEFLKLLARMDTGGMSQVIMATHAPILMALPGARLLRIHKYGLDPVMLEDTDHYRLMREFILDWRGTVEAMLED